MKIRLSFQGWILGGFVLVVLCTLAFVVIFLQNTLRDQMVAQIRDNLDHQLVLVREVITDRWSQNHSPEATDRLADHLGARLGLRVSPDRPRGISPG